MSFLLNFKMCSEVISLHKLLVPAVHSWKLEDVNGNEGVKIPKPRLRGSLLSVPCVNITFLPSTLVYCDKPMLLFVFSFTPFLQARSTCHVQSNLRGPKPNTATHALQLSIVSHNPARLNLTKISPNSHQEVCEDVQITQTPSNCMDTLFQTHLLPKLWLKRNDSC